MANTTSNKVHIEYVLNTNDEAESILEGQPEDIVIGLSHLIATMGWDSNDKHDRDEAELLISTILKFLGEATPIVLNTMFDDATEE